MVKMKVFTLLTILQALAVSAAPPRRRQDCSTKVVTRIEEFIQVGDAFVEVVGNEDAGEVPVTLTLPVVTTIDPGGLFLQLTTSQVTASVSVRTSSTSASVIQILPSLTTAVAGTTGVVQTSIRTAPNPVQQTSFAAPTSIIATVPVSSVASGLQTTIMKSSDIFQPIATGAPPNVIGSRADHPVARLGIQPQKSPLQTNKFYANFFLGTQTAGTWTHPYQVAWAKGGGSSHSWGLAISHTDTNQSVYGPDPAANPVGYFINPNGIQSIVISAAELGGSTALTTDSQSAFSVNVNLIPAPGAPPAVTFPLVQGMAFVTGVYNGATPIIQSGVFFRTVTRSTTNPKPAVTKYTIVLEDGKSWLLYAWSPSGADLQLTVVGNGLLQSTSNWDGIIQIAKNSGGGAEALYDKACGVYATDVTLSGSVNGAVGTYTMSFAKSGLNSTTLTMFALPHHMQSFSQSTLALATSVRMQTTTKGMATAIVADSWTLVENNMPVGMSFAPWSPDTGSKSTLSGAAIAVMQSIAASEISQNMSAQTNMNSFYFSGKVRPSSVEFHRLTLFD